MTRTTHLHIATATAAALPASPEHRRFKTLLTKIEAGRARLAAWQQAQPQFAEAHRTRVQPVQARIDAARRAWALELGQAALRPNWSKPERETLERLVLEMAGSLLESRDPDAAPDEEIKALYNRFSEVDFDSESRAELDEMKAMMERFGGVDLGDEPAASMEDLLRRAQEDMARRAAPAGHDGSDDGMGAERTRPHGSGGPGGPEGRPRKPKARTAAQRRAEADAQRATQTVREVYRKLAAALHPDRVAPDASAAHKAERTELMQRANSAYEAGDLLALLTLQLQIEQVDAAHVAQVAASQVRHFNKVLAEQLQEIEAELEEREFHFCAAYGLVPERRLDPARLGGFITEELEELGAAERMMQRDQRALRGDTAGARRWLKHQRAAFREDDLMEQLFEDSAIHELAGELFRTAPMPRGGRGGGGGRRGGR